jgi:hypothetical protein
MNPPRIPAVTRFFLAKFPFSQQDICKSEI